MTAVTQMKAVFEGMAGRALTNDQLESIAANYNASWGDEWFVRSNPYDKQAQQMQWAAWPENATPTQLASFALTKMYRESRDRLRTGRGLRYDRSRAAELNAAEVEL